MYQCVSQWLDQLEWCEVSEKVAAFCFILYDECDHEHWGMDLIGAEYYDPDDADWACCEVTDLGSRNPDFRWAKRADWKEVLDDVITALREYLAKGTYAHILKSKTAVAVGFDDGDLHLLFTK